MKLRHNILIGELVGGIVFLAVLHLFFAVSLTISLIILFVILFPIEIIRQFDLILKWRKEDKRGIYILQTSDGYRIGHVEYPKDLQDHHFIDTKRGEAVLVLNFGKSKIYPTCSAAVTEAHQRSLDSGGIKWYPMPINRTAIQFPKMTIDEALTILPYYSEVKS